MSARLLLRTLVLGTMALTAPVLAAAALAAGPQPLSHLTAARPGVLLEASGHSASAHAMGDKTRSSITPGEGAGKSFCKENQGTPLGATFDDVFACGPATGPGDDFDTAGFQCVELSERYLWVVYNDFVPDVPSGRALVSMAGSSLGLPIGTPATNQVPVPGDVVSMWGGPKAEVYGHTAVVTAVDVNSDGNGTITIMEENGTSDGWDQINVNDWMESYGDPSYDGGYFYYNHIQWLELKPAGPPATSNETLLFKPQGLGANSVVTAINGTGTVTGYVSHVSGTQTWLQPFLFNQNSWIYPQAPSRSLHVVGINNRGVVAAWGGSSADPQGYALHSVTPTKWNTLPLPGGSLTTGQTTAIDAWGDVSGWLTSAGSKQAAVGAVWTHSHGVYKLRQLLPNKFFSTPHVLSSDPYGDAVGTETLGTTKTYATVWAPAGNAYRLPGLSKINVTSTATAMRTLVSGQSRQLTVVGSSENDMGVTQAVEWTVTITGDSVKSTVPALLAGAGYTGPSTAVAINSAGWVAGNLGTTGATGRVFIYRPQEGMVDLSTLLPVNSWVIDKVAGMNSVGQIVGQGYNPTTHSGLCGVILTPYLVPTSLSTSNPPS